MQAIIQHPKKNTPKALGLAAYLCSLFLPACVSFDSGLQTGRILTPGSKQYSLGTQIYLEHQDSSSLKKRGKGDDSLDLDQVETHQGFQAQAAYGLLPYADLQLRASLGMSSIEPRVGLYSGERWASALGAKLLFPSFSFDYSETFLYGLSFYQSLDISPNFTIYAVPTYLIKPIETDKQEWIGFHAGMIFGEKRGLAYEWSYFESRHQHPIKAHEEFKLAYVMGLDELEGKYKDHQVSPWAFNPSLALSAFATPALGFISTWNSSNQHYYELHLESGLNGLAHPLAPELKDQDGFMSLNYYALRSAFKLPETLNMQESFVKLGLARRKLNLILNLDEGWHTLSVTRLGIDFGLEKKYSHSQWEWVSVFIPFRFLAKQERFYSSADKEEVELINDLKAKAQSYSQGISLSFFRWQRIW